MDSFIYLKNTLVLQGKAHLDKSKNIQIPYEIALLWYPNGILIF